jgi:hypothetical protein
MIKKLSKVVPNEQIKVIEKSKTQKKKVKKALKGKPGELILRQSKYFKTIADPYNYRGIRIPDLTLFPSTTFSITDRRQITVGSNGSCYCTYGIAGYTGVAPRGGLVPMKTTTGGTSDWVAGMTSQAGATTIYNPNVDMFPAGGTVPNYYWFPFTQWNDSINTIPALFDKVRIVSGAVSIDYAGTDFDNAGTITSVFLPRYSIIKENLNSSTPTPISFIQSLPGSIIVPVNKNRGSTVMYRPQDGRSLDYTSIQNIMDLSESDHIMIYEESLGGEILHIVTGATAGKVFQLTATFNYEGIPLMNTVDLFQPVVSKSDPLELSTTFNALENVSPQSIGTDEALGVNHPLSKSAPNNSMVEHDPKPADLEPSLMDRVMGGLGGAGNVINSISGVIKKGSPLLELALEAL